MSQPILKTENLTFRYTTEEGAAPTVLNGLTLSIQPGEFVAVIEFSPGEYLKNRSAKAVEKTLSIPAWLNSMAEARQLNFSAVLQPALIECLNAGLSE